MKYQVIFTRENKFSHVKRLPLLWLHNTWRLSQENTVYEKWFGNSLIII